jgi:hypothetical protein
LLANPGNGRPMAVAGSAQNLQLERDPGAAGRGRPLAFQLAALGDDGAEYVVSYTAPLTGLTAFCVAISQLEDL